MNLDLDDPVALRNEADRLEELAQSYRLKARELEILRISHPKPALNRTTQEEKIIEAFKTRFERNSLSVRSYNCLRAAEIDYVLDLVSLDIFSVRGFRNFGKASYTEVAGLVKNLSGVKMTDWLGKGELFDKPTKKLAAIALSEFQQENKISFLKGDIGLLCDYLENYKIDSSLKLISLRVSDLKSQDLSEWRYRGMAKAFYRRLGITLPDWFEDDAYLFDKDTRELCQILSKKLSEEGNL